MERKLDEEMENWMDIYKTKWLNILYFRQLVCMVTQGVGEGMIKYIVF